MDKKAKIMTTLNIVLVLLASYKVYSNNVRGIYAPIYQYILAIALILLFLRARANNRMNMDRRNKK